MACKCVLVMVCVERDRWHVCYTNWRPSRDLVGGIVLTYRSRLSSLINDIGGDSIELHMTVIRRVGAVINNCIFEAETMTSSYLF